MTKPGRNQITELNTLKDTPPWKWPKETGKLFLKILQDPGSDPTVRLLAIDLAGDFTVMDDRLAEVLLDILENEDETENLRTRAAISLGPVLEYSCTFGLESDDSAISPEMAEQIKESFHRLYETTDVPKEVRRRILEVSVRAPQGWHKKAVRAAYASDDEDYKLTSIFCMGFIPGFDNEIMEAMECDNPVLRNEAVRAAGNWQVDMDWLDIDSPLISGEDDNSLFNSGLKAATGDLSTESEQLYNLRQYSNKDEIIDALHDVLTRGDLPWDDELIDIDDDDDF